MPKEEIRFNKNIYKRKAIELTVRAFKKVADFGISEDKKYYIVDIKNNLSETKDNLEDNFCNYVLSVMSE